MRTSPRTESSTLWDNSPANAPLSVPDCPLTGGIRTREDFPAYRILHPLGQFTRQRTSQRPRLPTHWRNLPAAKTLTVRIPPVAGTISTPIDLLQSENLHPLEELIRWYTSQHPDSPTHWRNLPAHTPPNCPDSSSEWRDPDTSSRTVSTAAIVWTRRHAGWRAWRTPSPLQGTQTPSARPIGWQSRIRRP